MGVKIYHHNDPDGYFGAAMCTIIADSLVSDNRHISGENNYSYTEVNYPKVFPVDEMNEGDLTFIVDVSFGENTFNQLKQICEKASHVYWIDHHATSKNEVVPLLKKEPIAKLDYFVDTRYCGAVNAYLCWKLKMFAKHSVSPFNGQKFVDKMDPAMVYSWDNVTAYDFKKVGFTFDCLIDHIGEYDEKYFRFGIQAENYIGDGTLVPYQNKCIAVPVFLVLLDDYDCFKQLYPESNYFTYGIRNEPLETYIQFTDDYFFRKTVFKKQIKKYITNGKAIVDYLMSDYKNGITNAFEYDFSEYGGPEKTICINGRGNSWVFSDLFEKYDMCCLFHYDKNLWVYSIYANPKALKNGIDCSKIAKQLGGGGHPGASGFKTSELIFKK